MPSYSSPRFFTMAPSYLRNHSQLEMVTMAHVDLQEEDFQLGSLALGNDVKSSGMSLGAWGGGRFNEIVFNIAQQYPKGDIHNDIIYVDITYECPNNKVVQKKLDFVSWH